jgi:hypothetical protein
MRDNQILEARVIEILRHGIREDSFVDRKESLPEASRKCARQIGALCNAARGGEAAWVLGVANDGRLVGVKEDFDLARWWPSVEKNFNEVAPAFAIYRYPTRARYFTDYFSRQTGRRT